MQLITRWLMFFMIYFGLGYATLNRFSPPHVTGLSDSIQYFRIIQNDPSAAEGHMRYRILVPYLAKPIYQLTRGHVGSWDPTSFALLIVNSAFCASSASMLLAIAGTFGLSQAAGFITALVYLLNFQRHECTTRRADRFGRCLFPHLSYLYLAETVLVRASPPGRAGGAFQGDLRSNRSFVCHRLDMARREETMAAGRRNGCCWADDRNNRSCNHRWPFHHADRDCQPGKGAPFLGGSYERRGRHLRGWGQLAYVSVAGAFLRPCLAPPST
jgi:hypothetical protein